MVPSTVDESRLAELFFLEHFCNDLNLKRKELSSVCAAFRDIWLQQHTIWCKNPCGPDHIEVCPVVVLHTQHYINYINTPVSPLFLGSDGQSACNACHLQDLPTSHFLKTPWFSICHNNLGQSASSILQFPGGFLWSESVSAPCVYPWFVMSSRFERHQIRLDRTVSRSALEGRGPRSAKIYGFTPDLRKRLVGRRSRQAFTCVGAGRIKCGNSPYVILYSVSKRLSPTCWWGFVFFGCSITKRCGRSVFSPSMKGCVVLIIAFLSSLIYYSLPLFSLLFPPPPRSLFSL